TGVPAEPAPSGFEPAARILPVSARCPDALDDLAGAYAQRLGDDPHSVADLCYSSAVRRTHHPFRTVAVGADPKAMAASLLDQQVLGHRSDAFDDPRIVFVFPGLG